MATRMPPPRIGIALGSGVARGWAHIGVLRALERAGIQPDIVCGTSIGALVGGIYLGGQLDALETWARGLTKVKLARLFDYELGHGGLISGRRILRLFNGAAGETTIEELPKRFACVCTDFDTGHEVWLQHGNLSEAILASCALPGVAAPVNFEGRWLLDGALVNPIPVSVCRALGAQVVIAVNLNADIFGAGTWRAAGEIEAADERAITTRMKNLPGAERLRQLVGRWNDGPSLLSVMTRSLTIVQDRISRSRLAGDPPDVTITPRLKHIGVFQFDRAQESIEAGEAAVEPLLPGLREVLGRSGATR